MVSWVSSIPCVTSQRYSPASLALTLLIMREASPTDSGLLGTNTLPMNPGPTFTIPSWDTSTTVSCDSSGFSQFSTFTHLILSSSLGLRLSAGAGTDVSVGLLGESDIMEKRQGSITLLAREPVVCLIFCIFIVMWEEAGEKRMHAIVVNMKHSAGTYSLILFYSEVSTSKSNSFTAASTEETNGEYYRYQD